MAEILDGADVVSSPSFASPDRALVFETKGPVAEFRMVAAAVGLEWLTEDQLIEASEDEDSEYDEVDEEFPSVLYVTMPSLEGLQKVLFLWRRYARGDERRDGEAAWWKLFGLLRDVRIWSAKDRIDPSTIRHLDRLIEKHPSKPVRLELDLWFREDAELRAQARDYLEELLVELGGSVLDFATIHEIAYQAALVELPVSRARELQDLRGPVAEAERVMRVRPQSLFETEDRGTEAAPPERPIDADYERFESLPSQARPAIAALLDGYPIANHDLLTNRIRIQEVDVTAEDVPVARRFHGTTMASLILHGDLDTGQPPLDRSVISVPILAAPQGLYRESTPPDKLPIPLVMRAVQALVSGIDGSEAAHPSVVVINHSVCDTQAPFSGRPSPWARMLDYLAHRYQLLFIVSAGNVRELFEVSDYADLTELDQDDPLARQIALLRAVERAKGTRSILSPAESINSLTVGALHEDASNACGPGAIEPFSSGIGVANVASSVGMGVNRGIKPDLVEAGGRQMLGVQEDNGVVSVWAIEHGDHGQLAASADPHGGSTAKVARSTGTSNAAALVTRSAMKLADLIEEVLEDDGEVWTKMPTRAVILKALLTHGCSWGDVYQLLNEVYPPSQPSKWQRRREAISRFLGYGRPDISRVMDDGGHRITLLADDLIAHGERHEYLLPIPRAMINNRELRRVILTLAWSSPIDPLANRYRAFALEMTNSEGKSSYWNGVKSIPQPHIFASRRGTLQHIVLEGKQLLAPGGSGSFSIGVQARSVMKEFEDETVPYALAMTLELAQPVRDDLRADVAARIRHRTRTSIHIPNRIRIPR